MSAIISINDNNLLIQKDGLVSSSRGYAWLVDGKVIFDFDDQRSALSNSRLQPQQSQNRYWQQCAQTSLSVKAEGLRNSADLIWQHLCEIQKNHGLDQVVFVVPSHYQQDNLQLLLGIANSSGLQSQGLVNKAVLIVQHHAQSDGKYLHIDLQLHQTVCSLVEVAQGVAKLSDVDIFSDVSIELIYDALLKYMQQSFIQSDRFDPLHYAETEQQLFDQLATAAKEIAVNGKANLAVKHSGRAHRITIDSKQWGAVIQPFADKLLAVKKTSQFDHLLLQLNKLFDGIVPKPFSNKNFLVVNDALLIQSSLVDAGSVDGEGLVYRLELPIINRKQSQNNSTESPTTNQQASKVESRATEKIKQHGAVTHLMQAGLAVPLSNANVVFEGGQLQLTKSTSSNVSSMLAKQQLFILNDTERRSLRLNDRLGSNHADGVISAIKVIE